MILLLTKNLRIIHLLSGLIKMEKDLFNPLLGIKIKHTRRHLLIVSSSKLLKKSTGFFTLTTVV